MTSDEEPIAKEAYDQLAEGYDAEVDSNPYNADLEFPATTSLIPDVDGACVLDAGCGTGTYTEWLLDHGADVVGVDVSDEMLAHARERVGDRGEFRRANLTEPLAFADDDSFDGIVSALALGYVEDWRSIFAEFARILHPDGFLVFSVQHPMNAFSEAEAEAGEACYFAVERATKEWSVDVPYYRRPFAEIMNPLLETGFGLDTVLEPRPTEAFREKWPERYEKESRYPVFVCVRATNR